MPLISIRLAAGRTDDELRALVREVSEAAASALELPVERVTVHLFELAPTQIARGGRLVAEAAA
jgi:4-oxalocrotonate tautomerase